MRSGRVSPLQVSKFTHLRGQYHKPFLSICIPTWNRCDALGRQLRFLLKEVSGLDSVEVCVSDNGSTDRTREILISWKDRFERFQFQSLSSNLGYDRNVVEVARMASGEYIWLLSDDDILISGSVKKILGYLESWKPCVLILNFLRPNIYGYLKPFFKLEEDILLNEPSPDFCPFSLAGKISSCVIKKDKIDFSLYPKFIGTGYMQNVLVCSALLSEYCLLISKECFIEEDVEGLYVARYSPKDIVITTAKLYDDLIESFPYLGITFKKDSLLGWLKLYYAGKIGTWKVPDRFGIWDLVEVMRIFKFRALMPSNFKSIVSPLLPRRVAIIIDRFRSRTLPSQMRIAKERHIETISRIAYKKR